MTCEAAKKLAAVVAKWGKDREKLATSDYWASGYSYALKDCADELQPILAELQQAQGRIGTMGEAKALYDEGFADGQRAEAPIELIEKIFSEEMRNWGHSERKMLMSLSNAIVALLSAPTPAERALDSLAKSIAKLESVVLPAKT